MTGSVRKALCSLDPGIRTFQTGYDTDSSFKIEDDLGQRIRGYARRLNRMNCRDAWYKKLSRRLHDRIRHIVDDVHYKACNWLCNSYNTIIIGNMSTVSIAKSRRLPRGQNQLMYLMSHYQFRQRLKHKSEICGCIFVEQDESYTSKTCGACGELNHKLGGNKTFACDKCRFTIDRDVNGARNIMMKAMPSLVRKTK